LVESRGRIGIVIQVEAHEYYEDIQNVRIRWACGETIWWFNACTLKKLEMKDD
tara:strand:+ start:161 stop:319 length:159 start_codon:yes stop_codon:yes gene_type:complete